MLNSEIHRNLAHLNKAPQNACYIFCVAFFLLHPLFKTHIYNSPRRLAKFAQLDFFPNQMQRFVEDSVEDAGHREDATDDRTNIGGQVAKGAVKNK